MNAIRVSVVIVVLLLPLALMGEVQQKPRSDFLATLTIGDTVSLKESAGRYEITILKDVRGTHTITEVGPDFFVIDDFAKVTETRIPVYSIKAIVRLKIPKD